MSFRQWGKIGQGRQLQKLYSLVLNTTKALGQCPGHDSGRSIAVYNPKGCCIHLHYRKFHSFGSESIGKTSSIGKLKWKGTTLPNRYCFEQGRTLSSITNPFYSRTRRKSHDKSLLNKALPLSYTPKSSIFSDSSSTKKEFTERRIMGYSRDQMFMVVSDVENYSKFLPWCESSVVTQRTLTYVEADLVIGMKPVTESYTSRVVLRRPSLIIAESNQGAHFKTMITKWQFSPGLKTVSASCIVDFFVSLEFKSVIHANLANVFFNEVVKAMAGAFYEEAKRRHGKESVPSRKIEVVKSASDKTQF